MKTIILTSVIFAGLFAWPSPLPTHAGSASANWVVDPVHSSVVFKIKHANCAWFYGMFERIEGTITEADAPADWKVDLKIDVDSLDARHPDRDKHLRTPDFFDVKQYPSITFTSTKVAAKGDALEVTGDLQLRGKTKSITAIASKTGEGEFQGKRAGFTTTLTINRSDFGMNYGIAQKVLGDEVELVLSLECTPAPK